MNKKVYELEVGVHLDKDNEEYDCYGIGGATPTTGFGYYDENRIEFLDYAKAKEYADYYVKSGVNNTYAFIFEETYNIENEAIEEIKNNGYFDHEINVPHISTWLYYIYKDNNGEIKTIIDKGE